MERNGNSKSRELQITHVGGGMEDMSVCGRVYTIERDLGERKRSWALALAMASPSIL